MALRVASRTLPWWGGSVNTPVGRVIVSTVPCDADWSDWTSGLSYIPFVQESVRYLARGEAGVGA